jgi:rubrerythrin
MKDSLKKLGDDYGLTPEGVRHAIEAYQDIICEITGGRLSKLTYDTDYVLEETEEYYKQKYTNKAVWKGLTKSYYKGRDYDGEPIWGRCTYYFCSNCGRRTVIADPFCPSCGASMEKEM